MGSEHKEVFGDFEYHGIALDKPLFTKETKYQKISFGSSPVLGKILVINGRLQSTQNDEYIYHEALVHPALIAHPCPKEVCIIGGGTGATAREALKHKTITKAVTVDIDPEMINIAQENMPSWHQGSWSDRRSEVVCDDAMNYLRSSKNRFDAVLGDLTEPIDSGPSADLFKKGFYQIVYDALTGDGIICLQAGSAHTYYLDVLRNTLNEIKAVFPFCQVFTTHVPTFGTAWGFIIASKKEIRFGDIDAKIRSQISGPLFFYDNETHQSMFNLTKPVRKEVG